MNRFSGVTIAILSLLLAGCSALPLPAEVDIGSRLGDRSQGSFEEVVVAGELDDTRRLPGSGGECVDFSDVDVPVTVQSARIHYDVDVSYDGPELSGKVQVQLYAAASSSELWEASSKVGPTITLNLDRASTGLAGTAVLGPEQLRAINGRHVCWGLEVTGRDAEVTDTGTAKFGYRVNDLRLSIRFSVI